MEPVEVVEPAEPAEARTVAALDEPGRLFTLAEVQAMNAEMERFTLEYDFAMREVETKLSILQDEFTRLHDYNPIEHVSSRLKSAESIVAKVARKGIAPDLPSIRRHLVDIAGIRVTCAFIHDAYRLFELLTQQDDITVAEVKDYIAHPKPNGYQSLHAIIGVPVFLSSGPVHVPVEIQFRSIAMDFWASLEHKIHYKYDGDVPAGLVEELRAAADTAAALDARMAGLHRELHGPGPRPAGGGAH